ncbi:MAG: DUF3352 domain-containing protein [Bacteroidales bacterium]|nr:DUF3352 domain-containing protein [Bacteroidales bacterium]
MSGFWKVTIFILIALLAAIAGYFAYSYYKSLKDPHLPAIHAISPNTVFFTEIKDFEQAVYKLTHHSKIWQAFLEEGLFTEADSQIKYLDSLFLTHGMTHEILSTSKLILSLNLSGIIDVSPLFILELPQGMGLEDVKMFIKEKNGEKSILMSKSAGGVSYQIVNLPHPERLFYFTVHYGLFIGSFTETLVTEAIYQLDHGRSMVTDADFTRIVATAGKNVDANLFIHFKNLGKACSPLVSNKLRFLSLGLNSFATYSETDLIINPDEVLFNGYTVTSDSMGFDLDALRQAPQKINIPEVLPRDVSWMAHFGIEKFTQFLETISLARKMTLEQYSGDLFQNYEIDLEKEFYSWIGNEYALSETDAGFLAVFQSNDILKAGFWLEGMENKVRTQNRSAKKVKLEHNGYQIKKLSLPELLGYIFGEMFKSIDQNYYITLKDYVIFSDKAEALTKLIDNFYLRKTLANDLNYQSFSNNISDRSNIFLYANLKNTGNLPKYILAQNLQDEFIAHSNLVKNFEGIALQFSYINQMFYTNLYLKYNPGFQQVIPTNWEFDLEQAVIARPYLIKNHQSGKLNIIAFDANKTMYLADHLGAVIWKKTLLEAPLGDINLVDFYNNGKFQYLFNTENYIYLVDLKGNDVGGFPVKLPTPSTNPLAVFDYNNDNDYRMILALNDNKIYNYNKSFEETEGWNKIQAGVEVKAPVQHLTAGKRDYIFVTDEKGNVMINNRKGEVRIDLEKHFTKAMHSVFYINNTNSKGIFITTDDDGNVVYINTKGNVKRTSFGTFSADHYFIYADFDNNGSEDFIFADKNKLVVFDRFKAVLFEYQFDDEIVNKPLVFQGRRGLMNIALLLNNAHEIQVFSKNGREYTQQFFGAETCFDVGAISGGNSRSIIAGLGNKVVNYLLEE